MSRAKLTLPVLAIFLGLVLNACGGADASSPDASTEAGSAGNATDAAFVVGMLPHHEGGVALGQMAAEKGVDPKIRELGKSIEQAQTREASTLRDLVEQFGADSPMMAGPIAEREKIDMEELQAASGPAFDRLWLDVISGHHVAAIQMAEIERAGGTSPEAQQLATAIIETQSEELTQFNDLVSQMPQ